MRLGKGLAALTGAAGVWGLSAGAAFAAAVGHPEDWQFGLQAPGTIVDRHIHWFHDKLLFPIITAICLLVAGLLVYIMFRFNAKANPEPSRTTHNTFIEVIWTVAPVLILLIIAIPSFRLLYLQREIPAPDMTIKATGNQWYWSYAYDGGDEISFDSFLKEKDKIDKAKGEKWLLTVDTPVVVPVGKIVRVIVTASDVLHSWTVPSFGTKIDAVPGRLNELWFKADIEGTYYGQCSELCGKDHAFMPIEVKVVSQDDYDKWHKDAKSAGLDIANERLYARLQSANKVADIKH